QRQCHKGSGRQIANGSAPFPTRQRLQHHDDKRAKRKPDPEKPGEEVGVEKLSTIEERADYADDAGDQAENKSSHFPVSALRCEGRAVHCCSISSCFAPVGSASPRVAC